MTLLAQLCAVAAGLFGLLTLAGYAFDVPAFIALHTGLQAMSPLTAAVLLLLTLSTLALSYREARLVAAAAALAGALGLAVLVSHLLAGADAISPWLVASMTGAANLPVGRMSIATAFALLLVALALPLRRGQPLAADLSAGAALLIASTALLGYLYGVGDLYALPIFNSMALHTAIALVLLAWAALTVEPRLGWASMVGSDDIGGGPTRRQFALMLLPVVAGLVLTRSAHARSLGPAIAMSLLVIVTIVPWILLVLRDGHVMNALDRARHDQARDKDVMAREMSKQLALQARQLARESAERAKAEEAVNRTQRLELIGRLTGSIAHDFNNLLMAVRGNLEMLEARLPPDDARLQRYIANALSGADKGTQITEQLLAFSRSQRMEVRPAEIDPAMVAAKLLIGTSLGPHVNLTLDLRAEGLWAMTDPRQLELAILNLAMNARDAMPDGGHITIESRAGGELLDGATRETPCVMVRVVDDGAGMEPEILERATEPFFTTRALGQGTGLGLAQVDGFVRQCRGELRLASVPGIGTSVEMLFRETDADPEPAAPAAEPGRTDIAPHGAGQQIVVIDDDDGVRAVIADGLTHAGFEVLEAKDGETGLALIRQHAPAAAVIDFLMPGLNGAEVARRAQLHRPNLPIIFVSGYSDTVALEGVAGAVVLRKPFDIKRLNLALHSVLD
ncbi:MAG: response regulator [Sphingomonadales bacterium]|nr:response regulator [Sphingomonadales bacterium]